MGKSMSTGNRMKRAALTASALAVATTTAAFAAGTTGAAAATGQHVGATSHATTTATPATSLPVGGALQGVVAISAKNAWAVGLKSGATRRPILAHWNGSTWVAVSSPALPVNADLHAVAAFPGGAWVVGSSGNISDHSAGQHLILRLTGNTLKQVKAPAPVNGGLVSVAADSAKDAWAGGFITSNGPLLLHWNGTSWKRSAIPADKGSFDISALAADSAKDAWAIETEGGHDVIFHWNGQAWKRSAVPAIGPAGTTHFRAVTAISSKNAWVVGDARSRTLVLHWNGQQWKRVPSPNPTFRGFIRDSLDSASAASANSVWAVGATPRRTLAEHWNGKSWSATKTPSGDLDFLNSVSVSHSGSAFAVGGIEFGETLVLHSIGRAWQQQ